MIPPVHEDPVTLVGGLTAGIVILVIVYKIWSTEREAEIAKKEKLDALLKNVQENNRLRDRKSLVERANEYWKRRGKPPGPGGGSAS